MAGDWIKMEAATPDKPEVLAITVKMGWDDPDYAVGKLFRVWRWFDQHTTDGNAFSVTPALLDRIVGVTGFAEAMQSVNWLVISDNGISLPRFDRHCGNTAKSRAETAKRVAAHRANAMNTGASVGDVACNEKTVTGALAREEKRREEKKEQKTVAAPDAPASPAVIQIQTNTGAEFAVTEAHVKEFTALYPAVDVMGELRKMRGWAMSNPNKRKTKGGMMKFINSWLSKQQDSGKPQQPKVPAPGSAEDYFLRAD